MRYLALIILFFLMSYNFSNFPIFDNVICAQQDEKKVSEYIDNEYNYAFQFPSGWKLEKPPNGNDVGEVRVMVKSPNKNYVMVTVGHLGKSVTKEQFYNNPNRNELVQVMIEDTIDQVYKKTSKDVNATKMTIAERGFIPSELGIEFYINTAHFLANKILMLVAGIHVIPFGKDYMVTFMMVSKVDNKAKEENETLTRVFNSFHIIGEQPNEAIKP